MINKTEISATSIILICISTGMTTITRVLSGGERKILPHSICYCVIEKQRKILPLSISSVPIQEERKILPILTLSFPIQEEMKNFLVSTSYLLNLN